MNQSVIHNYDDRPVKIAQVREITADNVWNWLAAGWKDIQAAPAISLSYGLALTVVSYILTLSIIGSGMYFLFPQLLAGFFLLAPMLSMGLYETSRQLENGETPTFKHTLLAFKGNSFNILNMGVVLVIALIAWVTIAHLIVALSSTGITPATWQGFISTLFGTWQGAQLLALGVTCGAIIAYIIYSISAVAVPMLLDRPCNVFDAIQTSWNAVSLNRLPMLLWAAILIAIISTGFLTLFVGLVFGFPLASHATWHAYRDLVEQDR
jgi:uncharacterized membrane protein